MNIVLYTDRMEPITVIKTPYTPRQLKILKMRNFLVPVIRPPVIEKITPANGQIVAEVPETVTIWVEEFIRNGQEHLLFFTKDEELALILSSEILPGQRKAFKEEWTTGFAAGFLDALDRIIR